MGYNRNPINIVDLNIVLTDGHQLLLLYFTWEL